MCYYIFKFLDQLKKCISTTVKKTRNFHMPINNSTLWLMSQNNILNIVKCIENANINNQWNKVKLHQKPKLILHKNFPFSLIFWLLIPVIKKNTGKFLLLISQSIKYLHFPFGQDTQVENQRIFTAPKSDKTD